MVHLHTLNLGSNQFLGPIPDSLSFCRELRVLNLARNYFGGQIPETFKKLQALSTLSLSNASLNNISAALGILQQCEDLKVVVLTLNFPGKEIPADTNFRFNNLKAFILANCGLTGLIPRWLSSCTKLQLLDLSWNRLGGKIPNLFSRLEFLFYVDLSNNSLSGTIPKSMTKLRSLIDPGISFEDRSLDLPLFSKSRSTARYMQYKQIWVFQPALDLSHNRLIGQIWPEFGNLKNLHVFDLKHNYLSGCIPEQLSGMKNLEILDLSHNNLSGSIPSTLTTLSFLSSFSIAYNNLVGKVPSAGQFMTSPCSSFVGNIGLICRLCNCPSMSVNIPTATPQFRRKPKKSKVEVIGLPFAIGMPIGFIAAVTISFKLGWLFPETKKERRRTLNRHSCTRIYATLNKAKPR